MASNRASFAEIAEQLLQVGRFVSHILELPRAELGGHVVSRLRLRLRPGNVTETGICMQDCAATDQVIAHTYCTYVSEKRVGETWRLLIAAIDEWKESRGSIRLCGVCC